MQKNAEFSHIDYAAGWAPSKNKKREIPLPKSNPLSHVHHWIVFYQRRAPGLCSSGGFIFPSGETAQP